GPCATLVYCSFVIIVQSTISDQGAIFGEYVSEFSCSN
ncbi:Os07g0295601, partial [Oryza sativa Japonica Group]